MVSADRAHRLAALTVVVDNLGGFGVPGQPPTANFTQLSFASINASGRMGFYARDDGPIPNGQGIYAVDLAGAPFEFVSHSGDVPPGRDVPAYISDFQGASAPINGLGNMVLAPTANNEDATSAVFGLYFYDACTGTLERIVDAATSAPPPPDGLGDVWGTDGERFVRVQDGKWVSSGQFRSINNSDDVAFLVAFSTFNVGAYVAHVESSGGELAIVCPQDAALECPADQSDPTVTGTPRVCSDVTPTISYVDSSVPGCGDTEVVTRTWTADDGSGSPVSCDQTITVVDTTSPVLTAPVDATVECDADSSPAAAGEASATDNCDEAPMVSYSDATVPGTCPQESVITRTWIASDACGNNGVSAVQTVHIVDSTPPTITVDTTPISVVDADCSGTEAVTLPAATAVDTCDGALPVTNDAPPTFPAGNTTTVTYTATDACGLSSTEGVDVTVLYGADIEIHAAKHTVGTGPHPGSTKEPLVGIDVCAYDKSDGSCARTVCGGVSHQHYQCIVDSCGTDDGESIFCCTTDANGECTINAPPGDYLVISADATKTVLPDPLGVSASDLLCGEVKQKHLQQIVKVDGKKVPGKTTRLTGSELLIIEPEYVLWDDTEQLYPFVFETVGDWGVTATVAPPDGFVADYDELSETVDDEIEAVQFTITEVGSDLVPTETTFQVTHKGRRENVRSRVDIRLTSRYAQSRGFNVAELRARGLIKERPGDPSQAHGQGNPHKK